MFVIGSEIIRSLPELKQRHQYMTPSYDGLNSIPLSQSMKMNPK